MHRIALCNRAGIIAANAFFACFSLMNAQSLAGDVAPNVADTLVPTTTTVTSSLNPSTFGDVVTFTITVTAAHATPTGTVDLYNGSTLVAAPPLNTNGTVTVLTGSLTGGTHSITASYLGSPKFAASTSAVLTQTVDKEASATTVTSSLDPSNAGEVVTFTAQVTAAVGVPRGSVTFYDGSTSLGPATLGGGFATLVTGGLTAGTHKISASYPGSPSFISSLSAPLTQTVVGGNGIPTEISVVSSEPYNPYGHSITLTATVTSASGPPSGTVVFYNNGTAIGPGTLNSSGVAVFPTAALPAGRDKIVAVYGGGGGFNPSTSAPLNQITLGVYDVGTDPLFLVSDGTNMWVSNNGANTVTRVRQSDGTILGTFPVGEHPEGVIFDGTNIWVANYGSNTLTELNAVTGGLVGTFSAGSYPGALAFDGTNIWVASFGNNVLTEVQASNGAVVNSFTIGPSTSTLAGVLFEGTNIWVSNAFSNTVTKILASTGAVLGTFNARTGPGAMTFDGTNLWVANYGANAVTKLLASNGSLVGTYAVANPSGLAFDGANIWVSNYMSSTLSVLSGSTGALEGTFFVGEGPVSLAFDGTNMWVAVSVNGTVCKL